MENQLISRSELGVKITPVIPKRQAQPGSDQEKRVGDHGAQKTSGNTVEVNKPQDGPALLGLGASQPLSPQPMDEINRQADHNHCDLECSGRRIGVEIGDQQVAQQGDNRPGHGLHADGADKIDVKSTWIEHWIFLLAERLGLFHNFKSSERMTFPANWL